MKIFFETFLFFCLFSEKFIFRFFQTMRINRICMPKPIDNEYTYRDIFSCHIYLKS